MKPLSALLLAIGLSISFLNAQVPAVTPSILNSAGGSYDDRSSYFRFEWSFGELVLIQTFSSNDSSIHLTQGFLQPCTDKVEASPLIVLFEKNDYKLFPNPTTGKFELNFFIRTNGQMSLQLVDAIGRVLEKRTYQYDQCCHIEFFDLSRYANGVYYVMAELKPDKPRSDGLKILRRSGFKIVKLSN